MTEIVCIYQKEHASFFTSKATDGYEQFNYRGSNTISCRDLEENSSDIADFFLNQIEKCTNLSFMFDLQTKGLDKLAELLEKNYSLKANFYDLNKLKEHLKNLDALSWLSVQKAEKDQLENEIVELKKGINEQLVINKRQTQSSLKEKFSLIDNLTSAQKKIIKLNKQLETLTLIQARHPIRGYELIYDDLRNDVNIQIQWTICNGSILSKQLIDHKDRGMLKLGELKRRDGERYYRKNLYIDPKHIGKKIFLIKDYKPAYIDHDSFKSYFFAVVYDSKDDETDVKEWFGKTY